MISTKELEDIEIVRFTSQRISALNVDEARNELLTLFENPHSKIIFDLSDVTYIDSSGFGMFLHLLRAARSNYCTFRFCNLSSSMKNLFEIINLHLTFDIYPDIDSCIDSFRKSNNV